MRFPALSAFAHGKTLRMFSKAVRPPKRRETVVRVSNRKDGDLLPDELKNPLVARQTAAPRLRPWATSPHADPNKCEQWRKQTVQNIDQKRVSRSFRKRDQKSQIARDQRLPVPALDSRLPG